jgi:hypothetical protein
LHSQNVTVERKRRIINPDLVGTGLLCLQALCALGSMSTNMPLAESRFNNLILNCSLKVLLI